VPERKNPVRAIQSFLLIEFEGAFSKSAGWLPDFPKVVVQSFRDSKSIPANRDASKDVHVREFVT